MNHFSPPNASRKPARPALPALPSELLSLPRRWAALPKAELGFRAMGRGADAVAPGDEGEWWWCRVGGGEKAAAAAAESGDVGLVAVDMVRGADGEADDVAVVDGAWEANPAVLGAAEAEEDVVAADLRALWARKAAKRFAKKGL